jgi:hypothetical protein
VISLAHELKGGGAAEETVIRLLELQSKYGVDQEAMLIYLNSVNLMNILSLIARRYAGSSSLAAPVLPPLAQGPAPAGLSLENLLGTLMKLGGNQEGGTARGGQGLNPAALLALLGALSQNVDFTSLFNMLGSLFSPGGASGPGPSPSGEKQQKDAPAGDVKPEVKTVIKDKEDNQVVKSSPKREVPKVVVWDQLESPKK